MATINKPATGGGSDAPRKLSMGERYADIVAENEKAINARESAEAYGLIDGAVYLLVCDVKNPKPDRRQKFDWKAQVNWLAGTRFRIGKTHLTGGIYAATISTGRWESDYMLLRNAPAELLAGLRIVTPTLDEELDSRDLRSFKDEALNNLVATGVVTLEQVIKAAQSAAEEEAS